MLYGLAAALGWGLADLAAAIAGRRIGGMRVAVIAQESSLILLAIFVIATGTHVVMPLGHLWAVMLDGILAAVAYLCLYKSLELGPVALVSPIAAAYAALTILLAVVLLGEHMEPLAIAGSVASLLGVMLASTDLKELRDKGRRLAGPGVPWAIGALFTFGIATFIFGRYSQLDDWAGPTIYARVASVIILTALFLIGRRRNPPAPDSPAGTKLEKRGLSIALVAGLADVAGVAVFAFGAHRAPLSLITAASVAFILIPVIGGLVMFHERPTWSQGLGVVLVGTGLVLLALGA